MNDWSDRKQQLVQRFSAFLDKLEPPEGVSGPPVPSEPETPDLFSFFSQLEALRTETRRNNRRVAETLTRFDETLRTREASSSGPADLTQPLIALADRVSRMLDAAARPPRKGWFTKEWSRSWERQHEALRMLRAQVDAILNQSGLERFETVGETFDPTTMVAVATEPSDTTSPHHVIKEHLAGYRCGDRIVRLAEVTIASSK